MYMQTKSQAHAVSPTLDMCEAQPCMPFPQPPPLRAASHISPLDPQARQANTPSTPPACRQVSSTGSCPCHHQHTTLFTDCSLSAPDTSTRHSAQQPPPLLLHLLSGLPCRTGCEPCPAALLVLVLPRLSGLLLRGTNSTLGRPLPASLASAFTLGVWAPSCPR